MSVILLFSSLLALDFFPRSWWQASAYCIEDDSTPAVGYVTGSEALNWLASSSDSTKLALTSVNFASQKNEHYLTIFDTSTNDDDMIDHLGTVQESFDATSAALYAAGVVFSRDDQHLYVYYPEKAELQKLDVANIYLSEPSIATGASLGNPCHFVGMSSQDDFVILVDSENIFTFERAPNGSLSAYQRSVVPEGGSFVSSATADSAGDWLFVVAHQTIHSYKVVDGGLVSSQVVTVSSGAGTFDNASFIAITADSSSLYLQAAGQGGVVLVDATIDATTGNITLGNTSTLQVTLQADFIILHPDNSLLYAGRTTNGHYREYDRNEADGSLTTSCNKVIDTNHFFTKMLVSPDGLYLYVASGNVVRAYITHSSGLYTPSPTSSLALSPVGLIPAPTEAPTRAPTPSSTASPATAPTRAPTPSPTTSPPVAPTKSPTSTPTKAPAVTPTGSPATSPNVSMPPELLWAELSDTNSSFTLRFDKVCYCSADDVGLDSSLPQAVCGQDIQSREFDSRCNITRLLDEDTLTFFGADTTSCLWSSGSVEAVVKFEEPTPLNWDPAPNISLAGGYIFGFVNSSASAQQTSYATGSVELGLREAPPELIQAKFADDGASILVSFSTEGSASSGLIDANDVDSGSGPGPCVTLFNVSTQSVIGDGATCQWSGQRELTVKVGFDATVVPETDSPTPKSASCSREESCITLLDGGVRTTANAILSSVGSTPVLAPDTPPTVSTVLIAPQELGLCGQFSLDGRASTGAVSRTLSAAWNASAVAGNEAVVSLVRKALEPFQGSLLARLNTSTIDVGANVIFTLTTGNFLGADDTASVSLTRTNVDIPTITVVGSGARTVTRSSPLVLRVAADPPACEETSTLTYTWGESGLTGYDELGATTFENLLGSDPTVLIIPPYTLGYAGSSYLFQASATSSSSSQSSSIILEVTVTQGDLRALIAGGQYRHHTAGNDLVLDGSGSLDEDDIPEEEFPWRYWWTCWQNCSHLAGGFASSENSVFTIPAGNMEAGLVYGFSLNVSRGVVDSDVAHGLLRSAVSSIQVEVVSYEAPEVYVAANNNGEKLDPTTKVVIYGGVVEQATAYDLLWTQVSGDLDVHAEGWDAFFTTAQSGANLVARPNVLTGGSSYTFRLSATDAVSLRTGFAELTVAVNAAPTGGHIEATPRTGVAALDTFTLESLDWTDDSDDLPLKFSFSYVNGRSAASTATQHGSLALGEEGTNLNNIACGYDYSWNGSADRTNITTRRIFIRNHNLSLSVSKTQSVEWQGPLPVGQADDNHTMTILCDVSDIYGATATTAKDANGDFVRVDVTGWEESLNSSTLLDTLTDTFEASAEAAQGTPGEATSFVRAYASVLVQSFDTNSSAFAERIDDYQALVGVMIDVTMGDFGVLEYSTTTAGAVLGTLALLSNGGSSIGAASQGVLLASSASILDEAVEDGSLDSRISGPTMELLNGVMGAYLSPAGDAASEEEIGDDIVRNATKIVGSMMMLMEGGMVDGEEAATIESDYVQGSCMVTSSTDRISFEIGSSTVDFGGGAVDSESSTASGRRTMASVGPQEGSCGARGCTQSSSHTLDAPRRKLNEVISASPSTFVVTRLHFSANGRPSTSVDGAGITQIRVTSTTSGEQVPLSAPVKITMTATVNSDDKLPSCSFFNEDTGRWDSEGLVLDSVTTPSDHGDGTDEYRISCLSFHLSDFAVSDTDVEPVFQPVTLTAGLDVFRAREVSTLGIILTAAILVLLGLVLFLSRRADLRLKTAETIESKAVDCYVATGEPKRRLLLPDLKNSNRRVGMRRKQGHELRFKIRGQDSWNSLEQRFKSWGYRCGILGMHVLDNHPWAGVLSPSPNSLALSRKQLSLVIVAQVMVQMMVEACFHGKSSDGMNKIIQILVGLAAALPASIIVPRAFAASTIPPASSTVDFDWQKVVIGGSGGVGQARAREHKEDRWLREPNHVLAVFYLVAAKVKSLRSSQSSAFARHRVVGKTLARGTRLTLCAIGQLLLNISCGTICLFVGITMTLDVVLFVSVCCSLGLNVLTLDVLLSNKETKFSIMSFRVLFILVFTRLVIMTLQVGLSLHCLRTSHVRAALRTVLFGIILVKLFMCNVGELMPCMDAINEHAMMQLRFTKRYRRRSSIRRGVSDQPDKHVLIQRSAAIVIQARVRQMLYRKRFIRRAQVLAWYGDSVVAIRRKINDGVYIFLATYTIAVVWINVCYVASYDAPTIWSWVIVTTTTIAIDVLIRKPASVLILSAIQTIRSMNHAPHSSYMGKRRVY